MGTNVVRLESLDIGYSTRKDAPQVVGKNLNATLAEGELVFLLGPNGAGKSTLMRTMAGMQRPLAGRVLLAGEDVHKMPPREVAKQLAVVLTERLAGSMFNGYELVGMGRHPHTDWRGRLTVKDHDVIRWALSVVRSEDLAKRQIGEMSDGERQRILLARALAQEPRLLILDEITAFLDVPRRIAITQILLDIVHREKRAVLLSSHDLDLALRIADRIWLYPKGGKMQTGIPEQIASSGAIGAAFDGEDVQFDPASGSFRLRRPECGVVLLHGTGTLRFWTQRALERRGYVAATAGSIDVDLELTVEEAENGSGQWVLSFQDRSEQFTDLEELLTKLDELGGGRN